MFPYPKAKTGTVQPRFRHRWQWQEGGMTLSLTWVLTLKFISAILSFAPAVYPNLKFRASFYHRIQLNDQGDLVSVGLFLKFLDLSDDLNCSSGEVDLRRMCRKPIFALTLPFKNHLSCSYSPSRCHMISFTVRLCKSSFLMPLGLCKSVLMSWTYLPRAFDRMTNSERGIDVQQPLIWVEVHKELMWSETLHVV